MERMVREQRFSRLLLELHPAQLESHGQTVAGVVAILQAAGYIGWGIAHDARDNRRAAYSRRINVGAYLRPFSGMGLGDWPHSLWVRPGLPTLP